MAPSPVAQSGPGELPDDLFFEPDISPTLDCQFAPSGHILVRPLVNEEDPRWWVFDSGAGRSTIDPEYADELGLESWGVVRLMGVGGAGDTGSNRRAETFRLGPLVIDEANFAEMQCDFLATAMGVPVVGICGFDVFSRAVVTLDRRFQNVELHDPEEYELPEGATWEPIKILHGHPIVKCKFEGDREGWFRLDTGAGSGTVTFHAPAVEEFQLLEGRTVKDTLMGGVGGTITGKSGTISYFEIGGHRFGWPQVEFATEAVGAFADADTMGNLGGFFLEPFEVVMDYQSKRIAFVPREVTASSEE